MAGTRSNKVAVLTPNALDPLPRAWSVVVEFPIDQEVTQYPARAPTIAVGPTLDPRSLFAEYEDSSTLYQVRPLSVGRSSLDGWHTSTDGTREEQHGIKGVFKVSAGAGANGGYLPHALGTSSIVRRRIVWWHLVGSKDGPGNGRGRRTGR